MEMRNKIESASWRFITPTQTDDILLNLESYQTIVEWIKSFLAQPHPNLGRTGAVCPFVPKSLNLDTLFLKVIRTSSASVEEIKDLVISHNEIFFQLEPSDSANSIYKSILLIFPDINHDQAPELIDSVQKELKPLFVEKGLMIGEFHKMNNGEGLHNPNFFPLQSPIPMLAIRYITEGDIVFLNREVYEPSIRVGFLENYLRHFAETLSPSRLACLQAQLAQAQQSQQLTGGL